MATVSQGINTTSTSNTTSYASGSFTPNAGDLLVVYVVASGTVAADATCTDSQNNEYTLITTAAYAASVNTIYLFVANTFATNTSNVVTFHCTSDAATGCVIQVYTVQSMTRAGSAAIRQSAVTNNGSAAGTPAATFAGSALTTNPTIGCVGNGTNPAGLTPPSGWTELPTPDVGYATPTTGQESVHQDSGFTGTTITWGGTSASAYGVLIAELDTSALPTVVVPTLAQNGIVSASIQSTNSCTTYKIPLPNNSGSNNCILAWFNYSGATTTCAVTDNIGNTYSSLGKHTDSGNSDLEVFGTFGATAGVNLITATFSIATADVKGGAFEFYNVVTSSATDGSSVTNEGSGTAVSAGPLTTSVSGDLIFQVAIQSGTDNPMTSWTAGASQWLPLALDIYSDQAAQYKIQTSAGTTTPSMTFAPTNSWLTVAVALKAATTATGTPPAAGIRVNSVYQGLITSSTGTGFKVQFPCQGNLLVGAWIGGPTVTVTSITDTLSNTWTVPAKTENVGNGSGVVQLCYAQAAATSSTLTATVNFSNVNSNSTIFMYDISGAASTTPFDNLQGTTGTAAGTSPFNSVSITPSTTHGVIFSACGVNLSSIKSLTAPSGGFFDVTIPSTIPGTGVLDEDNGWAHYYNATTAAVTFQWGQTANVGAWAAQAAAFKAPAGGSGVPFEDDSFNASFQAVLVLQPESIISVW